MLELLSGSNSVKQADGTLIGITLLDGGLVPSHKAIFDDELGIISCRATGDTFKYTITQLDGVTYDRANIPYSTGLAFVLDLSTPNSLLCMFTNFHDTVRYFDKKSGSVKDVIATSTINMGLNLVAMLSDRFLFIGGSTVSYKVLDLSGSFISEATLTNYGTGLVSVSKYKEANVLCLAYRSGSVIFYDYVKKQQVLGVKYLPANIGAWYSIKYGVFVVATGTSSAPYINIYSENPQPTSLSNPSATLTKGKSSLVSVTLAGSNSEVCSDELIEWSLTGDGSLSATQSKTDSSGIAQVRYIAPFTITTAPTITAQFKA